MFCIAHIITVVFKDDRVVVGDGSKLGSDGGDREEDEEKKEVLFHDLIDLAAGAVLKNSLFFTGKIALFECIGISPFLEPENTVIAEAQVVPSVIS